MFNVIYLMFDSGGAMRSCFFASISPGTYIFNWQNRNYSKYGQFQQLLTHQDNIICSVYSHITVKMYFSWSHLITRTQHTNKLLCFLSLSKQSVIKMLCLICVGWCVSFFFLTMCSHLEFAGDWKQTPLTVFIMEPITTDMLHC